MTNRASAERPVAFTSARLRLTIERKSSNSDLLGCSFFTRPCPSSAFQVNLPPVHEKLWFSQYSCQEMISGFSLPVKFRGSVNGGIDLPAKHFSRFAEWQGKL